MSTEAAALMTLRQAVARLAPSDTAVAVSDPQSDLAVVWPEEAPAIAKAVPKRRREFAAGRHAARMAMVDLGAPEQVVCAGADRAPIWPDGLTGSISHDAQSCVVILGPKERFQAIGVDVEPDAVLPDDLISEVCAAKELAWLMEQPDSLRGTLARRIFCAKEATFKAQYPLTQTLFGFETLEVSLTSDTRFTARFTRNVGEIPAQSLLTGQVDCAGGHVFAVVTIGAQAGMENADFPFCATG